MIAPFCTTETGGYANEIKQSAQISGSEDVVERCFAAAPMLHQRGSDLITAGLSGANA
jgi:hypothetical protein